LQGLNLDKKYKIKWEFDRAKAKWFVGFENLMEESEKIYEVELISKGEKIYRWTHMTKDVKKLFKPYGIADLQTYILN
jgi:tRNA A22 N-methylase